MPLSEHEQRLLDQIERALYAEDPKFATTVRSTDLRTHMRRRLRRAAAVFVVGFVLMLFGIQNPVIGISGFVIMLAALLMALSAWKRIGGQPGSTLHSVDGRAERTTRKKKAASQASPLARLEERWKRRWDGRGNSD